MKTTRRDFLCLSAMACAWLLTGCQNPTVEERAVSWQQQEVSDPVSETGPMWNAALDDNAVLRDGIRVPQNFELPLEGSTGFAGAAVMLLYERPDGTSTVLRRLAAGDMFYIRQESGAYWQVCLLDGTVGWLENELCMINLPDVLPSIVYENPNAKASIFKICGKDIEGITGQKLYDGLFYNQRLGRDEYLMPINYAMAKKVGAAQKNALKEGDCLKIIETFRPYEVQMLVKDAVYAKARMDKELMTALNKGAWADVSEAENGAVTAEALTAAAPTAEEIGAVSLSKLYVYYGSHENRNREGEGVWLVLNPGKKDLTA